MELSTRHLSVALIMFATLLLQSCNHSAPRGSDPLITPPSPDGLYAITQVTVLPMDSDAVLQNQTVLIRDGRIERIGSSSELTPDSGMEIINGSGRYLIPGLAEMHGHIPSADNPQFAEDMLFLYISNGVTTVRNMLGNAYHLELREQILNGAVDGPTVFAASPWLSSNSIPTPRDAHSVVHEYKQAGFDLMKMGNLPLETYLAVAEAAHEIGLPFAGHIPGSVPLETALEARQMSIDHYDRYVEFMAAAHPEASTRDGGFFGSNLMDLVDESRMAEAVALTVQAGTWNVPTLSLVEHLTEPESGDELIQRPEMRYMPENVLHNWAQVKNNFDNRPDFEPENAARLVQLRRDLTLALHQAGAPIVLGSDAPQFFNVPGFSIHHEMRMMVDSGLTPYEVLVTGTRNAALYFDTPGEFGTIVPGSRADLILLDAHPFDDIAHVQNPAGVMVRGQWWSRNRIQERLEEIAARN
jgi:imidazolonepropionase-like amidohydrolase